MQFIRTRIKKDDYKDVEPQEGFTIVRWDAVPETIQVPIRKKGKKDKDAEQEYETKETNYLVCTERVYHGDFTAEMVRADIDADLALRYPEGNAPTINVPEL